MRTYLKNIFILMFCITVAPNLEGATIEFNFVQAPNEPNSGFYDPTPLKNIKTVPFLEQELINIGLDEPSCLAEFGQVPAGYDSCMQWLAVQTITNFGENPGQTLGELRRNSAIEAAKAWETALDSNVNIVVQAAGVSIIDQYRKEENVDFNCQSGVGLAYADSLRIFANAPGSLYPNTFYSAALANKLAGVDLASGPHDPGLLQPPFNDDIIMYTNNLFDDLTPECIANRYTGGFYYGYDRLPYFALQVDLITTVQHELGHGLGFLSFAYDKETLQPRLTSTQILTTSNDSGLGLDKFTDVFAIFLNGNATNLQWNQMNTKERQDTGVIGQVVWIGPLATAASNSYLDFSRELITDIPGEGSYTFNAGTSGPQPTVTNFTNNVVLVNDGVGNIYDACEPLINATEIAGNIALVDYLNETPCSSSLIGDNIENANATGLIIRNVDDLVTSFFGSDLKPTLALNSANGDAIKQQLLLGTPVFVTLVQGTTLAGHDANGHMLMTPDGDHFDSSPIPDLLMEPAIASSQTLDPITLGVMFDIGWDGQRHCPLTSEVNAPGGMKSTVVVGSCNSGVANKLGPYQLLKSQQQYGGCTINDLLSICLKHTSKGEIRSCITQITSELSSIKVITAKQAQAIDKCSP